MRASGAALAIGAAALLCSWLFGSVVLAPVGLGLLAAGLGARAWRRAAGSSIVLERRIAASRLIEGDTLEVELGLSGGLSAWVRAVAEEHVGGVGAVVVPLRRGRGMVCWPNVPRGRHAIGPAHVALEDPLGLERAEASAPAREIVLVHPRVVALEALFTDTGRDGFDGRRGALRRLAGVDLHSVRDYQEGEPLRLVHWPTTARRGALTVLEMRDAPRDETVVALDRDPAGDVGPRGSSSFDEAVRAAASLVHACAARGRRVALVGAAGPSEVLRVGALDDSWHAALDALAAVEPDPRHTLATLLADPRLAAARVPELIVISCRPEAIDAALRDARRAGGVVFVDAPTYTGAPPSPPAPALLRLAAAGVPVAVVRSGDDLQAVLGGAAHGARSA